MRRFAHAVSFEVDVVGVVHKPVKDGICDRGFTQGLMPCFDWELAGDDR